MADSTSPAAAAKPKAKKAPSSAPKMIDMVREAIESNGDRKGTSIPAIKTYILDTYKTVDPNTLKFRLKKALEKAMAEEMIVRPKGVETTGVLTGRFRLNKAKADEEAKAKLKKEKMAEKAKADKLKAAAKKTVAKKDAKPRSTSKSPKPKKTAAKATATKKSPKDAKKTKTKATIKKSAKSPKTPTKSKTKVYFTLYLYCTSCILFAHADI